MDETISYTPIGTIKTPFTVVAKMPIQPSGAENVEGIIELNPQFIAGLQDLTGFSHLILIYHFHLVSGYKLSVVPFMDHKPHGIFATRAPARPNAIGISIVRLKRIEENRLFVEGVDMLNDTPLLDIKPFFSRFDNRPDAQSGWLDEKSMDDIATARSDNRFSR